MPLGESTGKRGLRVGAMMRLASGLYVPASAGGVATPAPVLTSANYTQGDTAGGGMPIVLTGTDLLGATVNVDGTPVAPTGNTSTTVTFTLPAHAPGVVNITVTTAGGTSNALSFEYWSPASMACSHLQLATFATPTWNGTASAGSSGSRSFTTDTGSGFTVPTLGGGVGGRTQLVKDSTNDMVWDSATPLSSLISAAAYSVILLVKPTGTVPAIIDATNRYNEEAFVSELGSAGAYLGVGCHDAGAGTIKASAYHYDGTYTGPAATVTKDAWNCIVSRYDGANLKLGVNGGADVTTPKGNVADSPGASGSRVAIGMQYTMSGSSLMFELLAYALLPIAISDANVVKLRKYFQQRYGVTV